MMRERFTLGAFARFVMASALVTVLIGCLPYSTGPTEVGVRTNKLGIFGDKGVEETYYPPGSTFWFVPFLTGWDTFDTKLQILEMTAEASRGDRAGRDDLPFKTIDGNDISLDLIISYTIIPDQAPKILQYVARNDEELKDKIVRTLARSTPRDVFGELMTEDFYNAQQRTAKAEDVKDRLNVILADYGIVVDRVSPKDYRFNPAYQRAIEEKKIADQDVEKNKASANAAVEEYKKRVEQAKGEVAKMKAQADGEFERAKIEADAYYEQQRQGALAIEAEGRAEAEGIQRMNEALAGSGGEAMVKIAIAEALMNKRIMLLPIGGGGLDIRSTDINSLLELYGIQKIIEQSGR